MKIAALQMVSTPDVARNLDTAAGLIDEAARAGAALVALPEYFCLLGRRDTDKLAVAEDDGAGPIQQLLADARAAPRCGWWAARCRCAPPTRSACATAAACMRPTASASRATTRSTLFAYDNGRERYDEGRVLEAGKRRWRSQPWACASACRCVTTCGFRSSIGRSASRRATCCACRRRSPTPPGSRTGNCCCARGRSRTSAT